MKTRKEEKEKRKKKIRKKLRSIILLIFLGIIIFICKGIYRENKIEIRNTVEMNFINKNNTINIQTNKKADITNEYKGYKVLAKLEIPSVKIESYVLEENSEESMKISSVKFWGPQPNEEGNFCIAGHNYKKNNMFYNLFYAKKGDKLYLTDNKNGKNTYTIYDIYRVKPENISPIEQNTNGKKIVTLITCANYSKNRLIIQAIAD